MRFALWIPAFASILKCLVALVVFSSPLAISAADSKEAFEEFSMDADCPRPCLPVQIGGKEYRFIIDTGSAETFFDSRLRPHLGESRGRSFLDQKNKAGSLVEQYGPANAFVRNVPLTEKRTVRCLDLADFRAVDDSAYDGIVGVDFLKSFVLQVDFDANRIRLYSKVPEDVGQALPFSRDSVSMPIVHARLGGDVENEFMIDTGSQGGFGVSQAEFRTLYDAGQISHPELFRIRTALGKSLVVRGRLTNADIGSMRIPSALVSTTERQNKVGLACLSKFLLTIDFPGRAIHLKERKLPANQIGRRDLSGITIRRNSEETLVWSVMPSSPAEAVGMRAYDLIESIDGVPAKTLSLMKIRQIFEEPGRTVKVSLIRDQEPLEASVLLQEYRMERPILRWEDE